MLYPWPSFALFSPLKDTLRHLFLAGNPICLLPAYRERVLRGSYGPGLLVLDDLPVSVAEQRAATAAAAAAAAASGVPSTPEDDAGREMPCGRLFQDEGGRWRGRGGALDLVHFGVKVRGVGVGFSRWCFVASAVGSDKLENDVGCRDQRTTSE